MTSPASGTGKAKKIHHWKHGWIPLDGYARDIVAARKKKGESVPKPETLTVADKQHDALYGKGNKTPVKRLQTTGFAGQMAGFKLNEMSESLRNRDVDISDMKREYMGIGAGAGTLTFDPPITGEQIKNYLKMAPAPTIARIDKDAASIMDAIRNDGGFTYDPRKGGLIKVGEAAGYVVAIPGTEQIIGHEKVDGEDVTREDFAKGVAAVITQNRNLFADGAVLGGWYSPERNEYMVEVSQIMPPGDRDAAIELATERNQEAIFDLSTGEVIVTGGTGDAHEPAADATTSLTAKLSPEEVAAAKYYTGPGYAPINAALRMGGTPQPAAQFYLNKLDDVMAKSVVTHDTTGYRGVWGGSWLPSQFAPGDEYTDSGFMSTAMDPTSNYDGDTMMTVRVPKGAHALDLYGEQLTHHANEKELLLPRGTKMRVVSDLHSVDGKRVINLEVVV